MMKATTHHKWYRCALALAIVIAAGWSTVALGVATVTVNPAQVTNAQAPLLLGNAFDGRANFTAGGNAIGYFDPATAATLPIGQYWMDHLTQTSLRYPLGPVNVWQWKDTVGPVRPPQPALGNQSITFGLDEFMAMAASQGVTPANIHMLVNTYINLNNPNIPQAAQDAADLVEYLNMPAGQGYAWADQRAANGHPEPYGVQLFAMGNEPWATAEYDAQTTGAANPAQDGALRFAADAATIIAAMKNIDSSIKITLAAPTPRSDPAAQAKVLAWNQTLIDQLGDEVYALVPNLAYDSLMPTVRGVGVAEDYIDQVVQQVDAYNQSHAHQLHVTVGEHWHAIQQDFQTNPPTLINPDFAVQWQGAVTTADFILALAQKPEVERAHLFVFGNTAAAWHPIQFDGLDANGDPTYTIFPVVDLYEQLGTTVLDQAVETLTTSDPGTDGETYSVRSSGFMSEDGMLFNLIVVNRDPLADQTVDLFGLDQYDLFRATLLSAFDGATAESIQLTDLPITPDLRTFDMPALSVLLLEFRDATESTGIPEPRTAMLLLLPAVLLWRRRAARRRLTEATRV